MSIEEIDSIEHIKVVDSDKGIRTLDDLLNYSKSVVVKFLSKFHHEYNWRLISSGVLFVVGVYTLQAAVEHLNWSYVGIPLLELLASFSLFSWWFLDRLGIISRSKKVVSDVIHSK
jgi:hypothetical protein